MDSRTNPMYLAKYTGFGCQYGDSLAGSVGGGTGPRPSHEQGDAAGDVPAGTKSIAPPRHPAARH
jgi:hypothetical protein